MLLEDIHVIVPSPTGPYTTIQAAVQAALTSNPPQSVIIPSNYTGTDTYTNASTVPVIDLRPNALNAGSTLPGPLATGPVTTTGSLTTSRVIAGGVASGIVAVATAPAPITAAAAANVFVTTLNAPGNSVLEGIPFKVKASGYLSAAAGTYTATIQPLIYASTSLGFTASAAAAIFSAAAGNVTVASASAVLVPFTVTLALEGDTLSAKLNSYIEAFEYDNGAAQFTAPTVTGAPRANLPTSVSFTGTATAVQFQAGVTTTGAGLPATSVVALKSFFIEV